MQQQNFELVVGGVPYSIKVTPFDFNDDTRFYVNFNGSEDYVFAFDPTIGRLAPLEDAASTMPDDLENAIAEKLQTIRA